MQSNSAAVRTLSLVLTVLGITFIVGLYPLTRLWPAGWAWTPAQPEYQQIWFTVWSSVAHGLVMAVQALRDPTERGHLPGDVLVLGLIAVVLGYLAARASRTGAA